MKVGKQPWMKFYAADWRSKPALRLCSLSARGLWIEMLCIMHSAVPCGSLLVEGLQPSAADLACLVNAPIKTVQAALDELEAKKIFSRDPNGTIFSRRIRRDVAKAERDKANGKSGGNPTLKVVRNG